LIQVFGRGLEKSLSKDSDGGLLRDGLVHFAFVAFCSLVLAIFLDSIQINLFNLGSMDMERNAFCIFVLALAASVAGSKFRHLQPMTVIVLFSLTQFYQVSLGWEVPVGALSLARLLPILAQLALVVVGLVGAKWKPDRQFVLIWLACATLGFVGYINSSDLTHTGIYQLVCLTTQVPLWIAYLSLIQKQGGQMRRSLCIGGWIAFITFCLGTVAVIKIGSGLGLSGGLEGFLASRGVSEYNLILVHLILLWPLALYESHQRGSILLGITISLFLIATVLGLSRTGLFMIPMLILSSILILYKKKLNKLVATFGVIVVLTVAGISIIPGSGQLVSDWNKRLDISNSTQILETVSKLTPGGTSALSRDVLRREAIYQWQSSPIIGQGFGSFAVLSRRGFSDPHNISFNILIELGITGLICFYIFLGSMISKMIATLKLNRSETILYGIPLTIIAFLLSTHSVGGGLFLANISGFSVNSTNMLLLLLYLHPRLLVSDNAGTP